MSKIINNKVLKFIVGCIKTIIYFFLIFVVFVILMQRVSGNTLAIGGIRIFNVISGSMEPEYERGDLLIVNKIENDKIEIGQDIAYQGTSGDVEGRIVTHRVVGIDETKDGRVFHTKGLTNMVEDPEVMEEQIYGVVVHKMIVLSFINKLTYNIYAFYIFIVIPIGIIIFLEIKNIINNKEE